MSGGSNSSDGWRPEPKAPVTAPTSTGAGGGDGGVSADPCIIDEVTSLNSVNPTALRNVRAGDLLDVDVLAGPPPRLVAMDRNGNVVGSITSRSMLQLIECIQDGRTYVAEVLSIQGGTCTVTVKLK